MQTLIVKKKYSESEPFRQGKKARLQVRLKKVLIVAYCNGVIPSSVVKKIFKIAKLGEV